MRKNMQRVDAIQRHVMEQNLKRWARGVAKRTKHPTMFPIYHMQTLVVRWEVTLGLRNY